MSKLAPYDFQMKNPFCDLGVELFISPGDMSGELLSYRRCWGQMSGELLSYCRCWRQMCTKTLTLPLTHELLQIQVSYITCPFLVTRPYHRYQNFLLILTSNENATPNCTSISQGYIEYTFPEVFCDFMITKVRHNIVLFVLT